MCGMSVWSFLLVLGYRGVEFGFSFIGFTWYLGRSIINNVDSGGIFFFGFGRVIWDMLCGSVFSCFD